MPPETSARVKSAGETLLTCSLKVTRYTTDAAFVACPAGLRRLIDTTVGAVVSPPGGLPVWAPFKPVSVFPLPDASAKLVEPAASSKCHNARVLASAVNGAVGTVYVLPV